MFSSQTLAHGTVTRYLVFFILEKESKRFDKMMKYLEKSKFIHGQKLPDIYYFTKKKTCLAMKLERWKYGSFQINQAQIPFFKSSYSGIILIMYLNFDAKTPKKQSVTKRPTEGRTNGWPDKHTGF